MNKLDKMLIEARGLARGEPFLLAQLLPMEDCLKLEGYLTLNGRDYTKISEIPKSYEDGEKRIDELKELYGIAEDDCVIISFDYGGG